jgi:hypothetical protein
VVGVKAIQDLKTRMTALGGSLDEYEEFFCLDAPSGYVWRSNGNTSMTITFSNGSETWLTKAILEEMDNIRMGLERVTDPARFAEIRHLQDDDSWGAPEHAPATLEWPK